MSDPATTTLYRPVGEAEYDLIAQSGFRRFPPRLPHQPIFYPVTNFDYAAQIARDWNTKDPASGFVGYVLRFAIPTAFLSRYPAKKVGDHIAWEHWIPAEDLDAFNDQIVGKIELVASFGTG